MIVVIAIAAIAFGVTFASWIGIDEKHPANPRNAKLISLGRIAFIVNVLAVAAMFILGAIGCAGSQFSNDADRAWKGTREYFTPKDTSLECPKLATDTGRMYKWMDTTQVEGSGPQWFRHAIAWPDSQYARIQREVNAQPHGYDWEGLQWIMVVGVVIVVLIVGGIIYAVYQVMR